MGSGIFGGRNGLAVTVFASALRVLCPFATTFAPVSTTAFATAALWLFRLAISVCVRCIRISGIAAGCIIFGFCCIDRVCIGVFATPASTAALTALTPRLALAFCVVIGAGVYFCVLGLGCAAFLVIRARIATATPTTTTTAARTAALVVVI